MSLQYIQVQNFEIGNSKWKNLTEKGRLHVTILCCYQEYIKFNLIFNSKLNQQIIKIWYCFRWRLDNFFRKIDAFHIQKIAELFHWETDMCIYSESCLLYSPNSGGFRIWQKYSAHPLGELPITQITIFLHKFIEGMPPLIHHLKVLIPKSRKPVNMMKSLLSMQFSYLLRSTPGYHGYMCLLHSTPGCHGYMCFCFSLNGHFCCNSCYDDNKQLISSN